MEFLCRLPKNYWEIMDKASEICPKNLVVVNVSHPRKETTHRKKSLIKHDFWKPLCV